VLLHVLLVRNYEAAVADNTIVTKHPDATAKPQTPFCFDRWLLCLFGKTIYVFNLFFSSLRVLYVLDGVADLAFKEEKKRANVCTLQELVTFQDMADITVTDTRGLTVVPLHSDSAQLIFHLKSTVLEGEAVLGFFRR